MALGFFFGITQGPLCVSRNFFYGILGLQPSLFICAKLRYCDLRIWQFLNCFSKQTLARLRNSRTFASHLGAKNRYSSTPETANTNRVHFMSPS